MLKLNQKGFSGLEIVLAILLLVAVGGAGYYVYQARQSQSADNSVNVPQKAKTSTNTPSDSQTYLVIKEWGVKLPLSSEDQDAYYGLHPDGQGNMYAYISLKSLPSGCEVSNTGSSLGFGAIARFRQSDMDPLRPSQTLLSEYPNAPKVGDYYFNYEQANGGGCAKDAKTGNAVNAANKAIGAALANIKAN